ncbi:MAG: hypothetical protein A3J93_00895 [Candidatus Magasanikbacteria bacterium RIFOXYC2_FULL_42_28]|uniref:HaeII family restriction endonuclease n=1 Tax=Candidatus Magasanikbacteria bacterium RIFOXYC2_FULL_42_28 TaxID=1798704 RepID=A0A1F6NXH7_9BACT|nr:MAG: hypothetical protein A3J93_00895 [Candidatus Magasanikbacteria bacterium RIFOXYC2_FULL_42_28]
MPKINIAKNALDTIIRKSRVHLYKPIQIAEILFHHRTDKRRWVLLDLESYRNVSKKWRDEVSGRLVGRVCTSSQKFQDNIFEINAIPPSLLRDLGNFNKRESGLVEAYIYNALNTRLSSVHDVNLYVSKSTASTFDLKKLVNFFVLDPGLKRSTDKIYEILVYALFSTIVRALRAQITLEILNDNKQLLQDFEPFIKMVLGIDAKNTKITLPAALYRAGVANAADRGLDMWANFGLAVQVKHLTLTPEIIEDVATGIAADRIVVVCVDSEKTAIENLLSQVGWGEKIQGIITMNDLDQWYKICLSDKYRNNLGKFLLRDVEREFNLEFPSNSELLPFIKERGYFKLKTAGSW